MRRFGQWGLKGCILSILLFNLLLGGWSVNFLLDFFLARTIPFVGAAGIGMVVGELSVPVAIVMFILVRYEIL